MAPVRDWPHAGGGNVKKSMSLSVDDAMTAFNSVGTSGGAWARDSDTVWRVGDRIDYWL